MGSYFKSSIMTALALILFTFFVSSTTVSAQSDINSDGDGEEGAGKPCTQSFQCWRTEPVQDDGVPLSLVDRMVISKRLEISGGLIGRTRGARCRCKDSICQYFISTQQRFLPCEEF